jgi:hypothetical protein
MADLSFNCACDDSFESKTLAELRADLIRDLGYAAIAANPPTGMAALVNMWLRNAQEQVYTQYDDFRMERFFHWPLEDSVSLYDLADNADTCTRPWNPLKISWVGIRQNEANVWTLHPFIEPAMRGSPNVGGYPTRYDIRQCIEVWPVPGPESVDGTLIVLGEFGLEPFTDDAHTTTMDWQLVYYRALALGKRHYNKPDAKDAAALERLRAQALCEAAHLPGVRYIPGTRYTVGDCLSGISGPRGIRFAQDGGVRFDQTEA